MAFDIKPIGAIPNHSNVGINGFNNIGWQPSTPIFGVTSMPDAIMGQLVNDDFHRITLGSNWETNFTSGSAIIVSNALNIAGGSGAVNEYVRYGAYRTCLEKWKVIADFQCTEKSATSSGISFGVSGILNSGGGQRSVWGQINLSTGVNSGKLFIVAQQAATARSVLATSTAIAFSVNDSFHIEVERYINSITFMTILSIYCLNVTTGLSKTLSYSFPLTFPQTNLPNSTGSFGICLHGGTQTVTSFQAISNEFKNSKILFFGDSITYGLYGSTTQKRWASQTMIFSASNYVISGGAGDDTGNGLLRVPEILNIKPKVVVMMIGHNDIAFSVPPAVYQANYTSIRNQFVAGGIKVIHCLNIPSGTWNIPPLNTFIKTFGVLSDIVIDTFTPLANGTALAAAFNSGDDNHPNDSGHALIGQINYNTLANINIL